MDIDSCNLYTADNALHTGLTAVPSWCVDEFVINVFYWFKNFSSRQEDYTTVHNAMTDDDIPRTFMQFVDNRWLSIGPVNDRVLEHCHVIHEFFLKGKFN
jgi:hypothetical protein